MCVRIDLFISSNERIRVCRKQRSNKKTHVGGDDIDLLSGAAFFSVEGFLRSQFGLLRKITFFFSDFR